MVKDGGVGRNRSRARRQPGGGLPLETEARRKRSQSSIGRGTYTSASFWARFGEPWLVTFTALATVGSVIFLALQTQATGTQASAAVEALDAQTRQSDFSFLAKISPRIDSAGLILQNDSAVPVLSAAYWYLNFDPDLDQISEVEGGLTGLPACSSVTIPWERLVAATDDSVAPDDFLPFQRAVEGAEELHIALQAPSGSWFLVGASGSLMAIDTSVLHSPDESQEGTSEDDMAEELGVAIDPYQAATEATAALHEARLHELGPDTYWEGVSRVRTYASADVISAGNEVTGFGESNGPSVERHPCNG
ncbi:hypothetical protein [Frigoribacterium faeni]|uniref:hypothetical protein n=1 Tax=Frigoribacterium faeni TaxID=145483 RepID=UPI00241398D2|nr:hypothetical protein [Frigoribacterium faeni]